MSTSDLEKEWDLISDLMEEIPVNLSILPSEAIELPVIVSSIQTQTQPLPTIEEEPILQDTEMEMALVLLHMANQTMKKKRNTQLSSIAQRVVTRSQTRKKEKNMANK